MLLIFILYIKSNICGDVYIPVLYPDYYNTDAIFIVVEPLPFVPVMWIDLKLLYGWSSKFISFLNISVSRVTVLPGILAVFRIYNAF